MTITRETTITIICNRCKGSVPAPDEGMDPVVDAMRQNGWIRVIYGTVGLDETMYDRKAFDLCKSCAADFEAAIKPVP